MGTTKRLAALAVGSLWPVAACAPAQEECTLVGGEDTIALTVDPLAGERISAFRLRLCQRGQCGEIGFSTKPSNDAQGLAEDGISRTESGYSVRLKSFGQGWDADLRLALTTAALNPRGRSLLHRSESFHFAKDYPNGIGCEPTLLHHETRVTAGELRPRR